MRHPLAPRRAPSRRARVLLVLAVALGLTASGSPTASAAVVSRFTIPASSGIFGNFNGCTGEALTFQGDVLFTVTVTRAPKNLTRPARNFRVTIHEVARGVTATGTSGTRYVVPFSALFSTHLINGEGFTQIQRLQFISLGPAPDAVLFLTRHFTIRPDGTVAVSFEKSRFLCKG
jgi:hypothetical protein